METLTRYKAWSDARLYNTLAALSAERLSASTPIFAGSILRTLNHVYLMDVVWKSHLLGMPHGLTTRNPETSPPFAELHESQRAIDAWYIDYADALDAKTRAEIVRFTFIGGGEGTMSRENIVLHVITHTTYHRGHVTAMLNQLGVQPQATDLPVYLREISSGTVASAVSS